MACGIDHGPQFTRLRGGLGKFWMLFWHLLALLFLSSFPGPEQTSKTQERTGCSLPPETMTNRLTALVYNRRQLRGFDLHWLFFQHFRRFRHGLGMCSGLPGAALLARLRSQLDSSLMWTCMDLWRKVSTPTEKRIHGLTKRSLPPGHRHPSMQRAQLHATQPPPAPSHTLLLG